MAERKVQGLDPADVQSYCASVNEGELVNITFGTLLGYEQYKHENIKLKQDVEQCKSELRIARVIYNDVRREHAAALRERNQTQRDCAAAVKYKKELQTCCDEREKTISDIIFLIDDFVDVYKHYVSIDVQDAFAMLIDAISRMEANLYGTNKQGSSITRACNVAKVQSSQA